MHPTKTPLRKSLKGQFFRGNKIRFSIGLLSASALAVVQLCIAWLLQQIVDHMTGSGGTRSFQALITASLGFFLAVVLLGCIDYWNAPAFYRKGMLQYKNFAFAHILRKNIAAFRRETTGTYLSTLNNDAATIETNYLELTFQYWLTILQFCGALAGMIFYSPLLALCAIGFSLLPLSAALITGKALVPAQRCVSDANELYVSHLKDSLSGFSVIKSFKAEDSLQATFEHANEDLENAKRRLRKIQTVIETITGACGIVAQLGVFLVGAYLSVHGSRITPGVVIAFVQLMNYVINPLVRIPQLRARRKAAIGLVDKLSGVLEENCRDGGRELPATAARGVVLKDVSFGFCADAPILHEITATFAPGKRYAIVGASGSGKSTLLSLMLGAYDTYTGDISIEGIPLRDIRYDALYDYISVVEQNVFIFDATIRENITMYRDFPKEDVDRAMRMAGLDQLIREKGEAYRCGENGIALSGGERQRISIARCLLRNARVLLVDEATAALDQETAARVISSILSLEDITRIVVTHALDPKILPQYDVILAMKDGRIVEQGTFEALMAQKGYFYSLYTVSQ